MSRLSHIGPEISMVLKLPGADDASLQGDDPDKVDEDMLETADNVDPLFAFSSIFVVQAPVSTFSTNHFCKSQRIKKVIGSELSNKVAAIDLYLER